MDHDETGCEPPPERPILCVNNCGFFGSAATMNMCSKCHKDMLLKQEQQAKVASAVSGSSLTNTSMEAAFDIQVAPVEPKKFPVEVSSISEPAEPKPKEGPSRCDTCNKRVGLTGFKCRCGNLFCAAHRYADKHNCQFDYHAAAQEAIAKANPVVKAEKLDKI